jgi:hypothetical protein
MRIKLLLETAGYPWAIPGRPASSADLGSSRKQHRLAQLRSAAEGHAGALGDRAFASTSSGRTAMP